MRGDTHKKIRPGYGPTRTMQYCIGALRSAVLLTALVIFANFTVPRATHAADTPPRAVVIFDGSGSMWGRIGAQTKFEVARTSMAAILPSYNRQIALGLIAYGHRRKSDCNDIEVLAPPEVGLAGDIVDSINAMRPRGKTPIASALESAATLLVDTEAGHIILLTDGAENCRKDLCETVDAIREASPRLTISTIGLGLRNRDVARVQCVAKSGGGRMVLASTKDELRDGLLNILDDVASGVTFAPPLVTNEQPVAVALPAEPVGPPILQLRALQAQTGPLIEDEVHWQVTRVDGSSPETIYAKNSISPDVEVPNGQYRIEARLGPATAARDITISQGGARSVHVPMNVARIDLQMAAPLLRGETIAIVQTSPSGDVQIPPRLVTGRNVTSERFFLPPGDYTIRRDGTAVGETRSVSLQAGDNDALTFDTRMGTLKPRMKDTALTGVEGAFLHIVQQKSTGNPDTWREVARSAALTPSFALPAGAYRLVSRAGRAEMRQAVTVAAGQVAKPEIFLPVGKLKLSAIDLSGRTLPSPLRYVVTPMGKSSGTPIRTNRSNPTLVVSAGTYKIEATAGYTNVRAITEVTLAAGAEEPGEVSFNHARLKFSIEKKDGAALPRNISWQVTTPTTDGTSRVLWNGNRNTSELALAPGQYTIIARIEDRATTRRVTLSSGETQTITLPQP